MTNSKSIYYLDNYYPKRYNKNDESSKRILELKNGREQAIEFWYSQLKLFLDIDCAIAIVPSHKQSNDNRSSGISSLAKKLIKDSPKRTDLVSSLNRHTTIEKLSGGGNREIDTHLHSIEVINKDLIKSQSILLLDDVTTSGNSLIACKQLLEEAGADEVICLALTKTVGGRVSTKNFVEINSNLSKIFSLQTHVSNFELSSNAESKKLEKQELPNISFEIITLNKKEKTFTLKNEDVYIDHKEGGVWEVRSIYVQFKVVRSTYKRFEYEDEKNIDFKGNYEQFLEHSKRVLTKSEFEEITKFINALFSDKSDSDKKVIGAIAHRRKGNLHSKKGNLEQAIKDYTQAIEINPNYTNAYIDRGLAYYKQGNLEQAIKDYTQALKINPNDANAYNNRAGAYIEQNNFENAIEDITQIIKLDPDNPDHYVRRGLTKHDNLQNNRIKYHIMRSKGEKLDEKFTNPIEDFTQAIKLNPNNPNYYVYRGVLYEEKNKFEKAIEDFTQVIHLEPNNSDHYINRGCAYYESYKFEKAIEDFTQAIRLEPNKSENYRNRGVTYYKKNEFENAMGDFTQAIRLDPNNFQVYQSIGDIYSSQCYFRKASENFVKATENLMKSSTRYTDHDTNNKIQELVEEIAKSYKRRNTHIKHINLDQAFNYYNKLLKISSENAEAYFVRGLVQFWQEKFELALDDLNQYMSLKSELTEDAETYFRQGVIFLVKADFRKAIKSFQKYLEFKSDCSEVYFLLGVANFSYYKFGEFINDIYCVDGQSHIKEIDEAIKNFDQALALNRNDTETYFMRGCVYKLNKNFAKAIHNLQQSIYLNSKHSEYYHTLGDIFYEQEKHQEALEQYNKALTIDASNPYLYQRIGEIYKKEESIKKAVNYFQKASNLFLEKSQEKTSFYRTKDMINYQETLESINKLISELTFREKHFIFRTSEEPSLKDSSEQVPSYKNGRRRRKRSSSIQKDS